MNNDNPRDSILKETLFAQSNKRRHPQIRHDAAFTRLYCGTVEDHVDDDGWGSDGKLLTDDDDDDGLVDYVSVQSEVSTVDPPSKASCDEDEAKERGDSMTTSLGYGGYDGRYDVELGAGIRYIEKIRLSLPQTDCDEGSGVMVDGAEDSDEPQRSFPRTASTVSVWGRTELPSPRGLGKSPNKQQILSPTAPLNALVQAKLRRELMKNASRGIEPISKHTSSLQEPSFTMLVEDRDDGDEDDHDGEFRPHISVACRVHDDRYPSSTPQAPLNALAQAKLLRERRISTKASDSSPPGHGMLQHGQVYCLDSRLSAALPFNPYMNNAKLDEDDEDDSDVGDDDASDDKDDGDGGENDDAGDTAVPSLGCRQADHSKKKSSPLPAPLNALAQVKLRRELMGNAAKSVPPSGDRSVGADTGTDRSAVISEDDDEDDDEDEDEDELHRRSNLHVTGKQPTTAMDMMMHANNKEKTLSILTNYHPIIEANAVVSTQLSSTQSPISAHTALSSSQSPISAHTALSSTQSPIKELPGRTTEAPSDHSRVEAAVKDLQQLSYNFNPKLSKYTHPLMVRPPPPPPPGHQELNTHHDCVTSSRDDTARTCYPLELSGITQSQHSTAAISFSPIKAINLQEVSRKSLPNMMLPVRAFLQSNAAVMDQTLTRWKGSPLSDARMSNNHPSHITGGDKLDAFNSLLLERHEIGQLMAELQTMERAAIAHIERAEEESMKRIAHQQHALTIREHLLAAETEQLEYNRAQFDRLRDEVNEKIHRKLWELSCVARDLSQQHQVDVAMRKKLTLQRVLLHISLLSLNDCQTELSQKEIELGHELQRSSGVVTDDDDAMLAITASSVTRTAPSLEDMTTEAQRRQIDIDHVTNPTDRFISPISSHSPRGSPDSPINSHRVEYAASCVSSVLLGSSSVASLHSSRSIPDNHQHQPNRDMNHHRSSLSIASAASSPGTASSRRSSYQSHHHHSTSSSYQSHHHHSTSSSYHLSEKKSKFPRATHDANWKRPFRV